MPYLTPITENGRPLSSVCTFCGKPAMGIQSLDCGIHFVCVSCSQTRRIVSICPLCNRREQHLQRPYGNSDSVYFQPIVYNTSSQQPLGVSTHHDIVTSPSVFPALPEVVPNYTSPYHQTYGISSPTNDNLQSVYNNQRSYSTAFTKLNDDTPALPIYAGAAPCTTPLSTSSVFPTLVNDERNNHYDFYISSSLHPYNHVISSRAVEIDIQESMVSIPTSTFTDNGSYAYQPQCTIREIEVIPAVPVTHHTISTPTLPVYQSSSVSSCHTIPSQTREKPLTLLTRALSSVGSAIVRRPSPYTAAAAETMSSSDYYRQPLQPLQSSQSSQSSTHSLTAVEIMPSSDYYQQPQQPQQPQSIYNQGTYSTFSTNSSSTGQSVFPTVYAPSAYSVTSSIYGQSQTNQNSMQSVRPSNLVLKKQNRDTLDENALRQFRELQR